MITEKFYIDETNPTVTLTSYIAEQSPELPLNKKRRAMLVIPGGGYWVCSEREAEPVGMYYYAAGYNVFVLKYSVKKNAFFPKPLYDICSAVAFIKENAEKFFIDPDYVYAVGFSAGGHLTAMLGTMWNQEHVSKALGKDSSLFRPRGIVLGYPVITAFEKTHRGSIYNLLGEEKFGNDDAKKEVSLEYRVTKDTVPAFIWHTASDASVPVENSLYFAAALAAEHIPFELHIFPNGPHGMSVCTPSVGSGDYSMTDIKNVNKEWVPLSIRWMDSI